MQTTLTQLLRNFAASVALVAFMVPCLCGPHGPAMLHSSGVAEAAHDDDSAPTGCCPDDESQDDDTTSHSCMHCGADYVLASGIDHKFDQGGMPSKLPPLLPVGVAFFDRSVEWTPDVEPIVVRRANPPPERSQSLRSLDRLAQLSVWLC